MITIIINYTDQAMSTNTRKRKPAMTLIAAACLMGSSTCTPAATPSVEDLWKIIQKQQKEIEALKEKAAQSEQKTASTQTAAAPSQSATDISVPVVTAPTSVPAPVATASTNSAKTVAPTAPAPAATTTTPATTKADTDRKTNVLANEIEKLKTALAIPDKREYKSMYGMGPAASQVYMNTRGLSIGGYGQMYYTNYQNGGAITSQNNGVDLTRIVLYAGYKFNDWIVLNNEFEFEHAVASSVDKGEVEVEFSYLDFLLHPMANIRTGLMLVPMGFINEIHEPLFFNGNARPYVEQVIIPTTWREMGVGLHGNLFSDLHYRMYMMNGLNAAGFSSAGIAEGSQQGSLAIANDLAYTGRIDYTPEYAPGLTVGASTFVGNAGQRQSVTNGQTGASYGLPGVFTQLYEGHAQWHYRGFEFRALGAWGSIGSSQVLSAALGQTIGSTNYGWYTEVAYDVLPWLFPETSQSLSPFFRYQRYNTVASIWSPSAQNNCYLPSGVEGEVGNRGSCGFYDQTVYQVGLTYKPHTNIVIKADYQNINSALGQLPGQFNLGLGFIY
jgi:hypothetical protein